MNGCTALAGRELYGRLCLPRAQQVRQLLARDLHALLLERHTIPVGLRHARGGQVQPIARGPEPLPSHGELVLGKIHLRISACHGRIGLGELGRHAIGYQSRPVRA